MQRRVGPVPLTCRLRELLRFAKPVETLGIWAAVPVRIRRIAVTGTGGLCVGADLGELLLTADNVLAWDGARLRRLPGARGHSGDLPQRHAVDARAEGSVAWTRADPLFPSGCPFPARRPPPRGRRGDGTRAGPGHRDLDPRVARHPAHPARGDPDRGRGQ